MSTLSPTDPLLSRAGELVAKHLEDVPTLWLKAPGDTPLHRRDSQFWQPWYPEYTRLLKNGWKEHEAEADWPQVVLFGGRQKEENRFLLQRAREITAPTGRVFFALPNDYGGRSFHKELDGLLQNYSGRKSRLFVLSPDSSGTARSLVELQTNREDLQSCPGLFSWDRADHGSRLLLEALQEHNLEGPIADLGAGWGYLSRSLPKALDRHMLEADKRGVAACLKNVEGKKIFVHWCDLTDPTSVPKALFGRFRTVVTNPPFHTHKRSDPVLGGAFVAMAGQLLSKNGALYLVGNSHLPYQKIIEKLLGKAEVLLYRDGYQIVKGIKS